MSEIRNFATELIELYGYAQTLFRPVAMVLSGCSPRQPTTWLLLGNIRISKLGQSRLNLINLSPDLPKNLHGRFCVRIVSGFETKFFDSQFLEEGVQNADEISQGKAHVRDHTFDLDDAGLPIENGKS